MSTQRLAGLHLFLAVHALVFVCSTLASAQQAPLARVVRTGATLRDNPSYDARTLRSLPERTVLFVVDDSDATWAYVQLVPSGQEGWMARAEYAIRTTQIQELFVTTKAHRPLVKLRSRATTRSKGIELEPGTVLIRERQLASGWWRVITAGDGRKGWIYHSKVHAHIATVPVISKRHVVRPVPERSMPAWLIAGISGVIGSLVAVAAALYLSRKNERALAALVRQSLDRIESIVYFAIERYKRTENHDRGNVVDFRDRRTG